MAAANKMPDKCPNLRRLFVMVHHAGKVFLPAKYRGHDECAVRKREASVSICMFRIKDRSEVQCLAHTILVFELSSRAKRGTLVFACTVVSLSGRAKVARDDKRTNAVVHRRNKDAAKPITDICSLS
jgi:hypothetical protein